MCSVVLRTGGVAPSEARVTINNSYLGEIPDIVKKATGSDFPELSKHSLLFTECIANSKTDYYMQSKIFTFAKDGSVSKEYTLPKINASIYSANEILNYVGYYPVRAAVSKQPFGKRYNVAYFAGVHNDNGSYGGGVVAPAQTLTYSMNSGNVDISAQTMSSKLVYKNSQYGYYSWNVDDEIFWDSGALIIKGLNKDVFVYAHSTAPRDEHYTSGSLVLDFFATDRNETGSVSMQTSLHTFKIMEYGDSWYSDSLGNKGCGLEAVDIATGDFDGDGYENEIALCVNADHQLYIMVYSVSYSSSKLNVQEVYRFTSEGYYHMSYDNSDKYLGASIAAGDFDGDGKQEVAVIYLSPQKDSYYAERSLTADVVKYRTSSRIWDRSSQVLLTVRVSSNGYSYYSNSKTDWSKPSTLLPTKADFDGDGKDEIALLTFIGDRGSESDSPSIIRLYCDRNSIQFKYDGTRSRYNDSCLKELSFELGSNYVNHSRRDYLRRVSITAGPVVGTMGKYKLADDIVISCVLGDRYNYSKYYRKIFVFSPTFWDNYNYIELNSRTIYNQSITAGNYGMSLPVCSVITGDFAYESLQLAKPVHTLDDTDKSYTTVLQAMPYHVDNVDINGNLTTDPINYTFSGFKGDIGSGKMRVAYTKTDSSSTKNDVTFNMASTTETISLLGDAGPYVHGYLKFRTMQANIAGNFDERAKAAAETMNTIMDLVTDKIDETTTKSTSEAKQIYTADTFDALLWDRMVSYSAQQHIWRYKILNNPLPSWYKLGAKADYSSRKTNADDEHFLTFAIYDTATPSKTVSNQDNEYQPRHEEGNFFSYPSDIVYSEGYHEAGKLRETNQWVTWTKGGDSSTTLGFEESKIESQKYEDDVSESELTKTVSAIATFFGADDPNPLPPYSSHSETFSKKLAKSEQIDVELYGRGDVPGEEAAHSIMTVPYIAKEGTL